MGKRAYRNPDHIRRRNMPAPSSEVVEAHLQALLSPAVYSQLHYYRQLGLRERILSLPLMMAAVLTLLWRQVPSVHELTRLLHRENLLWAKATKVSQQALDKRLLTFPALLFEQVLLQLLGLLKARWQGRQRRLLPMSLAVAQKHFEQLWVVDGSTLETLFRKLKSLQEEPASVSRQALCGGGLSHAPTRQALARGESVPQRHRGLEPSITDEFTGYLAYL